MGRLAEIVASFLGAGYSKFAPGTVGALFATALLYFTRGLVDAYWFYIPLLVLLTYVGGIWAIKNLPDSWEHDDGRIVVDEAHGIFITMLFVPFSLKHVAIGFVLFRLFDIIKPLGIKKFDQLKSDHGVMLDDTLAGIYSNVVLQILIIWVIQ